MGTAIKQRALLLLCIYVGNVFQATSHVTKIKTEYMKGKTVVSSYRTLYGYSKSACVSKCLAEATDGVCKAVGYDTSTRMCFLSSSDTVEEGGLNSGAFVLIKKASGCIEEGFLINGPNPLPRHYMTASSSWGLYHYPEFAILHNTFTPDVHIGSWCPTVADFEAGNSYIQVRFPTISRIVFLATQGRATRPQNNCCDQWLDSYTVEISDDCSSFNYISNEAGQINVFPGNTDRDTVVNNTMPAGTSALCIRLHAYQSRFPCVRMDVWGCQKTLYP